MSPVRAKEPKAALKAVPKPTELITTIEILRAEIEILKKQVEFWQERYTTRRAR